MTAASGDPGETPLNAGRNQSPGGYEAPPIEQTDQAYGGFATPGQSTYSAPASPIPGYPGYPTSAGFPPPPAPGQYGQPAGGFPPPGYSSPSAPGFGSYPPPSAGHPTPGQYGQDYGTPYPGVDYGYPAAPPGGTNTLAIISLVASVVGLLCGLGSIIAIVSGAVALTQIKHTREGGHGLAIAGIVIGVASLVISAVWMTYAWR